jgi:NTP pyrophosphatase (non-canonical NTP hydrolase)
MLNVPFTTAGMRQQEKIYKQLNDSARDVSWFGILMEEVYEAFAETDPAKQREEMVQVAAVAVQIIKCLDRRMEEGK